MAQQCDEIPAARRLLGDALLARGEDVVRRAEPTLRRSRHTDGTPYTDYELLMVRASHRLGATVAARWIATGELARPEETAELESLGVHAAHLPVTQLVRNYLGYRDAFLSVLDEEVERLRTEPAVAQTVRAMIVAGIEGSMVRLTSRIDQETAELQAELALKQGALQELAFHDALTSLPNRAAVFELLTTRLSSRRPNARCAVLLLDLDGFKSVNDTLGHTAGDELLVAFATRLRAACGTAGEPARLGGDEFLVVLQPGSTYADAEELAARVVKAASEPLLLAGQRVAVAASVGITVGLRGDTPTDVLNRADSALYEAKRAGGNGWRRAA